MKTIFKAAAILLAILCSACGAGSSTSDAYITAATSGTCTGSTISTNSCAVSLTYSTGGNTNLSLSYSCQPTTGTGCLSQFAIDTSSCPITNSTYGQNCSVNVTYSGISSVQVGEYITFYLGSAQANTIFFSNY